MLHINAAAIVVVVVVVYNNNSGWSFDPSRSFSGFSLK
jgi:hypothetical protein